MDSDLEAVMPTWQAVQTRFQTILNTVPSQVDKSAHNRLSLRLKAACSDFDATSRQITDLQEQVARKTARNAEFEELKNTHAGELDRLEKIHTAQKRQIDDLTTKLTELRRRQTSYESMIGQDIGMIKARNSEHVTRIAQLEQSRDQANALIEDMKKKHCDELQDMESKFREAQAENVARNEDLQKGYSRRFAALKKEYLLRLSAKTAQCTAQITGVREDAQNSVNASAKQLEEMVQDDQNHVKLKDHTFDTLNSDNAKLKGDYEYEFDRISRLPKHRVQSQQRVTDLEASIKRLEETIEAAADEQRNWQRENTKLQKSEKLRNLLNYTLGEYSVRLDEVWEDAEAELQNELAAQNEQHEHRINQLQRDHDSMTAMRDAEWVDVLDAKLAKEKVELEKLVTTRVHKALAHKDKELDEALAEKVREHAEAAAQKDKERDEVLAQKVKEHAEAAAQKDKERDESVRKHIDQLFQTHLSKLALVIPANKQVATAEERMNPSEGSCSASPRSSSIGSDHTQEARCPVADPSFGRSGEAARADQIRQPNPLRAGEPLRNSLFRVPQQPVSSIPHPLLVQRNLASTPMNELHVSVENDDDFHMTVGNDDDDDDALDSTILDDYRTSRNRVGTFSHDAGISLRPQRSAPKRPAESDMRSDGTKLHKPNALGLATPAPRSARLSETSGKANSSARRSLPQVSVSIDEQAHLADQLWNLMHKDWNITDEEENKLRDQFAKLFSKGRPFDKVKEAIDKHVVGSFRCAQAPPRPCLLATLTGENSGKGGAMTSGSCPYCKNKRHRVCVWATYAPNVASGYGQPDEAGVITDLDWNSTPNPMTVEVNGQQVRWYLKKRRDPVSRK